MAHPNLAFLENTNGAIFRYNEAWNCTAVGIYPCYTGRDLKIYGNVFRNFRGFPIFIYTPGSYSGGTIYNKLFTTALTRYMMPVTKCQAEMRKQPLLQFRHASMGRICG